MSKLNCNATLENGKLILSNSKFSYEVEGVLEFSVDYPQERGCSDAFLEVCAKLEDREVRYQLWEDLPVVRILGLGDKSPWTFTTDHYIVKSTKFNAFSDDRDTMWEQREVHMFRMGVKFPLDGDIYFFENPEDGKAMVLVSETPDFVETQLNVQLLTGILRIENQNCPIVLGFCDMDECEKLTRNYFRHANRRPNLITMSNTWGDMNGRDRVCADFIKKEVDNAVEMGVDIVQIDDGWQEGRTLYELEKDEKGRAIWLPKSWIVNKERFPKGIEEVTAYAKERGVKVGMWFLPYSTDNPQYTEDDKKLLWTAYHEWGVRFFKLDLYLVLCDEDKARMLELLRYIYSFGDDVSVQMDVTRNARLNSLCGREYGTIFVENRYAKSTAKFPRSYFPHRVLRNLWMISKFIPANRFQFELVNPDLSPEGYRQEDPFVPHKHSMDYLFAVTMLSNPLVWMEMQFLPEQRKQELAPLLAVWKQHRKNFCDADVVPIGEKPSGRSFTGFAVENNGDVEYLLLFREVTDRESAIISLPEMRGGEVEILASNCEAEVKALDGAVQMKLSQPRGYVLAAVKKA